MRKRSIAAAVLVALGLVLYYLGNGADGSGSIGSLLSIESSDSTRSSGHSSASGKAGERDGGSARRDRAKGGKGASGATGRAGEMGSDSEASIAGRRPHDGGAPVDNDDVTGTESVTPEEVQVMQVYRSLVSVLDDETLTCATIGKKMQRLVEQQQEAFTDFRKAQAALSSEARTAVQKRHSSTDNPRMSEIRQSLRQGLVRCAGEARVRDTIRRLAELGHAS